MGFDDVQAKNDLSKRQEYWTDQLKEIIHENMSFSFDEYSLPTEASALKALDSKGASALRNVFQKLCKIDRAWTTLNLCHQRGR